MAFLILIVIACSIPLALGVELVLLLSHSPFALQEGRELWAFLMIVLGGGVLLLLGVCGWILFASRTPVTRSANA